MKLYSNFLISLLVLNFIDGISQQIKVQPNTPQNSAAFGYSVSQYNNYLIIGAKDEKVNEAKSGAAYIYYLVDDEWVEQARLLPENAADGEFFGISVSIVGNYAVVGASGDDTNGTNNGAAYVFQRKGENWPLVQKLIPQSSKSFDEFGVSLSLTEQVLVIGAYNDDTNGIFAGAAYIFELETEGWIEKVKLLPEDVKREDKFGRSVDTDGKKVIIGSVLSDEQGIDSGSAYVFAKNETGSWIQDAKLLAPDGETNDRFGRSVAITTNQIAIGAVLDDDNGNNSGAVYVFTYSAQKWGFETKLIPEDGMPEDFFGYSISINSQHLLIGAPNTDVSAIKSGAAYLFQQSGTTWLQIAKFSANDGTELDNFGESVHIDNTWISIGAPYQNVAAGAVYIEPTPSPLAIRAPENKSFHLYPNPANMSINIILPNNNYEKRLRVIDSQGKLKLNIVLQPNQSNYAMAVAHLIKGVYLIVVSSPKEVIREKLIIY